MVSLKLKEIFCLLYTGVLFLSGVILIGFSSVLCYKLIYHFKFVPNETIGPFILMIVIGIVHLFITWIAVQGPSKEHDFFIIVFVILSIILLLLEFAIGIWSMIIWAKVGDKTVEMMKESQVRYFKHNLDRNEWISLERNLQCCGYNGTHDYESEKDAIPTSCLSIDENDQGKTYFERDKRGCREPMVAYVEKLLLEVALIGFLSGLMQIAGAAVFIIFYKGLKKERTIRAANRAARLRQSLHRNRPDVHPDINAHTPSAPT